MMSLMARFGCRDRDLVVEAIAAWVPWTWRMRPGGQVAQGGHDLGAGASAQPRPQTGVEIGGVQALPHPPDGQLRRQGLPRLQAQGPQIRRGQVGGVLPDGCQAPAACEHSRHGQGQDREQAVAHAPPIPGSVMFLRTWFRGWRTRADVVADDISAGSQDEEMTRHHSSSPRGPRPLPATHHPIKAAQTPSPTDLADPLTRHPFQFYESTTGMSVRRNESR